MPSEFTSFALAVALGLSLGACVRTSEPAPPDAAASEGASAGSSAPDEPDQPDQPDGPDESGEDTGAEPDALGPSEAELAAQKQRLRAAIVPKLPELQACYEAELAGDRSLAGKMTYAITIEAGGWVSEALVEDDGVGNEAMSACAVAAMRAWVFEPAGDGEATELSFSVAYTGV